MEFRRIPFQFTSTDPAKRQAELQKRFGLTPKQENMYIDLANPCFVNTKKKESNSVTSSPRLQHRVPIFVDGMSEADKSVDVNPTNVDAGQKSRVRVVPIEIENSDGSKRHRTLSGTSCVNGNSYHQGSLFSDGAKPKVESTSSKSQSGPKVYTIPVKIEGADENSKTQVPPGKHEKTPKLVQKNGCTRIKVDNSEENKVLISPVCEASLKKINVVLIKLADYQSDVAKLSGKVEEKQSRYLDEMLTRLMLDLDNVETMGNENVRFARKAAIKKVQHCIDLLEAKVNGSNPNQTESNAEVPSGTGKESEIVEMVSVIESSKVDADDSSDSNVEFHVPEVKMEDSKAVDLTEIHMASHQVQCMEMEDVKNNLVSEIGENESRQNLTESNVGLSDEIQLVTSGLEQKSEVVIPVEDAKSGDADGFCNLITKESEISEVEMEDLGTNTQEPETLVEVSEIQTELGHEKSMETNAAENVTAVGSESMSELGKDCSIHVENCDMCNEPSSLPASSTFDLSSDSIAQNKCSIIKVNEMESSDVVTAPTIPDVKAGQ